MTTLGFNGGYGYTKLYTADQTVVFPSIIGYPEQLQYQDQVLEHRKRPRNGTTANSHPNGTTIDAIQLSTPDGIRFIGQLAATQSRLKWTPQNRGRVASETMKLLLLAACSEAGVAGNVNLVTGLP